MQELENFKLYLAERRGKKAVKVSTRAVRLHTLKRLMDEVSDLEVEPLRLLFTDFREIYSQSYVNQLIVTLHIYGEYKQTDKYKIFKLDKVDHAEKTTLSDSEIEAFLALFNQKWKLFFSILCFSGMRPGECASLSCQSVDLGRRVFMVTGKTGFRPVPIASSLLQPLTDYMKSLEGELLFAGRNGTTMSREAWKQQFDKGIKQLGIKRKGLTCHSLRHSFITRMLSEDVNIFKVKRIVGHKRTETTELYTHLVTKDLEKALLKDPLSRQSLGYYKRFKLFREGVTKLLEDFALTPQEEKEMLSSL